MNQLLTDVWTYPDATQLGYDPISGRDLTGYEVEALDGSVGSVDDASTEVGSSYIIVDMGRRIFGKKVMLPAEVVQRVDRNEERIFVSHTKKQIKKAPEYDRSMRADGEYRDLVGNCFFGGGFHD